jgi:hypothetical protein
MPLTQIRVPVNIDKFIHPPAYFNDLGAAFCGDSLELLSQLPSESNGQYLRGGKYRK